ncbi:hypothetical protein AA12717_4174 [Gluconacetobacter sacchari DSM 12717]|uniref:Uncharacterized protein n=1 Tax=Gluconacetobacter sacchari DSM 12717 TaxID=1307940 RepID=A0ABQ0PEB5_9PROT|nr:hypothetical protein AA12717_4174 [Gluconacetobacter sacchari DSM 12717]
MAPDRIVETVDVTADSILGILSGQEDRPPNEFGFQGFEEGLDNGIVVTISLAGH